MIPSSDKNKRIVGVDMHPDVFTAAFLTGNCATEARVINVQDRVKTSELEQWASKNLQPGDIVVMEASGNSFEVAGCLHNLGHTALVLESFQASKIKDNFCNDDRSSAIKLARVYLSGLAKVVWQPDAKTRERRELFFSYRNTVKDSTRYRNRIRSYLSDHMLRLPKGTRLTDECTLEKVLKMKLWSLTQSGIIKKYFEDLWHAEKHRRELNAIMVEEVLGDRTLRGLLTMLGIRHVAAFAIGALVGDIHRFPTAKKLVGYIGLSPSKSQSGNNQKGYEHGIGRTGRKDLRAILIQSAQNAMNQRGSVYHKWGWKLLVRKNRNIAVAAVARKILTSVWHLLHGHFTPMIEPTTHLKVKVDKLATTLGLKRILSKGYISRSKFIEEAIHDILHNSCLPSFEAPLGALPQSPLLIAGEARNNNQGVELLHIS